MNEPSVKDEKLITDLLFGKLWDISVDGMRITDDSGIILLVNEAYCKTVRLNEESLLGKPFSVVYDNEERLAALEIYLKDIEHNEIKTHFERANTLWNGEKIWFEFSNTFLTLPDEKKITLSVIKDITARKRAELELRENEYKFKMLFNNANDAIFVTQLSEDKTYGDFVEVNDVACKLLGYTKEEFLRLSPSAIVSPKCIDDYHLKTGMLLSAGRVIYETIYKTKDKKLFPVEVSSHLFLLKNKSTVLSVARDITERNQAHLKLEKSSRHLRNLATRLQNIREEERSMIAREIHDELGQALTALKIHITLLSKKLRKDQDELKDRADLSSKMIDSIVESVQKISSKLRPDLLDELGLVAAIEWQSKEFEKLTNIKCSLIYPSVEIEIEETRATALFRIFQEALTNIARHSEADLVSVRLHSDNSKLILEIKDNGIGIAPALITHPRSLGLLGMRERAMVFGGEVIIDSIFGKGTLVTVVMPGEQNL